MTSDYDTAEMRRVRAGALLIAIIIAVSVLVFFLDALIRATTEGPRITVTTGSATGVEPGTAVWVAGRDVGRVLSVEFSDPTRGRDRVVIGAVLDRGVEGFIRSDAAVTIQPGALLEPVIISIAPGTASLPPWDLNEAFVTRGESIGLEALLELREDLRASGEGLRTEADRLRTAIRAGGGTLASLTENAEGFRETRSLAQSAAEGLARDYPDGTAARLAADTIMTQRIARLRGRMAALDTLSTRDRAVRSFEETTAAVTAFRERMELLSRRLEEGEGSAGRWRQDGELRRQLALLRARIDSTTVELMKAPDRWLRVKVF
jgi:ABC-type transporter Mla subunit MlaD